MKIDRVKEDVQFTRDVGPYVEAVLKLDALATDEADRFLFDTPDQAMAFRRFLWDQDLAMFSPPHGMVALLDGQPAAMSAGLTRDEELNRRMTCTVALHRADLLRNDPNLTRRLRLVAAASMPLVQGDYYMNRICVDPDVKHRGLSRLVYDAAIDHARAIGCTRIVGEINVGNALARRYFFWMGFRETSRGHATDPATGRKLSLIHVAREL